MSWFDESLIVVILYVFIMCRSYTSFGEFRGQGQGWGSFVLLDGGYVEGYGAPFTIMHS